MMGGPIDLTPFGAVVRGIGILYWVLAIGALFFALKLPKTRRAKAWTTLAVLVVFGYMPATGVWSAYQARSALNKATALFQERCKTAGEKIHRTVQNVEGVVWMKWREPIARNDDQFKLDDPYGFDCGGKDCITYLLRVSSGAEKNPEEAARHRNGYRFVETIDPADGKRYRYAGLIDLSWSKEAIETHKKSTGEDPPPPPHYVYKFRPSRVPINAYTARYGVTWDDISTRNDREHWIAGGSLKVIDLQTNEVIAERIGYMVDTGQGNTAGGRQPWSFAAQNACPEFQQIGPGDPRRQRTYTSAPTRNFLTKVLKPTTGE